MVGWVLGGLLVIIATTLTSCDNPKKSDKEEATPEEHKEEIRATEEPEEQPCTCNAEVLCTSALEGSESVHIVKKKGVDLVKISDIDQLNKKDIEREKAFDGCKIDNKCINEIEYIENQEWQYYDETVSEGKDKELLNKDNSFMICTKGAIIYFENAGQELRTFIDDIAKWLEAIPSALACTSHTSKEHNNALSQEKREENAAYIYVYLRKKGWSKEAIAGLLGNIERESGMNPGVWQYWEDVNYGYGLVQWDDATKFLNWAKLNNKSANDMAKNNPKKLMDMELEYLLESMNTKDYDKLSWYPTLTAPYYTEFPPSDDVPREMTYEEYINSSHNSGDLALIFHASYERSSDDKTILEERYDNANKWYNYFSKSK